MKMNIHIVIRTLVLFCLLLSGLSSRAQFGFDVGSIEASIDDHKRMRSVLLARSGIEQANVLLHQYSSEAGTEHKDITVKLEKYTKAFDMLDLIIQGTATVFTVKNTITDVSDYVGKYKDLIQRYSELCLARGNVLSSDTLMIGITTRLIERLGDDVNQLIASYTEVAGYVTGLVPCRTSDMLRILTDVNNTLQDIRRSVKTAYLTLWKYIRLRTGYWKNAIYQSKTMQEIANDAFAHWRRVAREVDY